jgi:hypothetical protein
MYSFNEEELKEYVYNNSQNDFVYIKFYHYQLRRSKKWFIEECRNLNNDLKSIKREILLEWSYASDVNPFEEDELAMVQQYIIEAVDKIMFKKYYKLEIYDHFDKDTDIAVSVDVSGGLSKDASAIVFNDPETDKTLAALKNNKIDTPDLREILEQILDLFPRAFLIIERNSYGLNIIQELEKKPKYSHRLFYTQTSNKTSIKRETGITTSKKTRPLIIESLKQLIINKPETIVSDIIFSEIKTLEEKKNGKIEHAEGTHDDAVMAKALYYYAKTNHYRTFKKFVSKQKAKVSSGMKKISKFNNSMSRKIEDSIPVQKDLMRERQKAIARKETETAEEVCMRKIFSANKGNFNPLSLRVDIEKINNGSEEKVNSWFPDLKTKK